MQEYPLDPLQAKEWVQRHPPEFQATASEVAKAVHYISFDRFIKNLRRTVEDFNRYLLSLPKDNRGYVLLISSANGVGFAKKSGAWVASIALPHLKVLPLAIVTDNGTDDHKLKTIPCDKVLVIDDASYSGTQLGEMVGCFQLHMNAMGLKNKYQIHIAVAFMTKGAYEKLELVQEVYQITLKVHQHCLLPSLHHQLTERAIEVLEELRSIDTKQPSKTLTYFAHKVPDHVSSLQAVADGTTLVWSLDFGRAECLAFNLYKKRHGSLPTKETPVVEKRACKEKYLAILQEIKEKRWLDSHPLLPNITPPYKK